MMAVINQIVYKAFGLRIKSEIPLMEVMQAEEQDRGADVEIRISDLADVWNELQQSEDYYAIKEDRLLFHVPEVAVFCIQSGDRILVSPAAGAEPTKIRLYLLGTCMGAILMQRKILPLHGSAVVIDGRAYAIVGDSGAGKSTLAAAFVERGFPLLSDDVIAVSLSDQGPVVIPAYPQQKLWEESIVQLGRNTGQYSTLYSNKFAVPVTSSFCRESVPLAGVFELRKSDSDRVELRAIQGLERLPVLNYHTYRNFLIPQLDLGQWHFTTITKILSHIEMNRLLRPNSRFTVNELTEQILNNVSYKPKTANHGG
ncbi:HPr kinase/phosphorylase [Paenibacillus tarimensis]